MLNNPDFYPTPSSLAFKMASMIDSSYSKRILEPSAGKGDLAEAVQGRSRYNRTPVDCIENDKDLQALLTGKGLTLIDSDFLLFNPNKIRFVAGFLFFHTLTKTPKIRDAKFLKRGAIGLTLGILCLSSSHDGFNNEST